MRIGELAARAGVSARSLRYYEEQGLLTSTRSASGQRHYTEYDVERVVLLQRMYTAGLTSRTIADVIPCIDLPSKESSDAALVRLVEERDRLSRHIEELVETRRSLEDLIAVNRVHRQSLTAQAPAATDGLTAHPA